MRFLAALIFLSLFPNFTVHARDDDGKTFLACATRTRKALEQLANQENALAPEWKSALEKIATQETQDPLKNEFYVRSKYEYYRCVFFLAVLTSPDPLYRDSIKELTTRMDRLDQGSTHLIQKILSGVHRITEMCGLYADRLNSSRSLIENIMDRLKYENRQAKSSQQQLRAALQRAFEMLAVIANKRNIPGAEIDLITTRRDAADEAAKTIFQQIDAEATALAELTELLATPPPTKK
jgi:hypothetical protein